MGDCNMGSPQLRQMKHPFDSGSARWLALLFFLPTACSGPSPFSSRSSHDHAFITYRAPGDSGNVRLAVKDLIDLKGEVTTAGSGYRSKHSEPALKDAPLMQIARERGVDIVGKTNLSEYATGVSGMNPYFGTPKNRITGFPRLIPGGSSSGSAVAVANDLADVAFGTDTAGSIRVPAACCGVFGLKTTYGRVSLVGVVPLSPKVLDTVGPMAKDIPNLATGMSLLDRSFDGEYANARARNPDASGYRVGRLYLTGTDPAIEHAIDKALESHGFQLVPMTIDFRDEWNQATSDGILVAQSDIYHRYQDLIDKGGISGTTKATILSGSTHSEEDYAKALKNRKAWQRTLERTFRRVDFIATATLKTLPLRQPLFDSAAFEAAVLLSQNTVAVNLAGNPAIAIPIPLPSRKKNPPVASLQLIGRPESEAELVNAGRILQINTPPVTRIAEQP